VRDVDVGDLQLEVPEEWSTRELPRECGRLGPGVLIANVETDGIQRYDDDLSGEGDGLTNVCCTTAWDLRDASRGAALVDISEFPDHVPVVPNTRPTTSDFPVELEEEMYRSAVTREPLCRCDFRHGIAYVDAKPLAIRVWVGEDASAADREAADALVASIRPT
jgi:hypothetical protein